MKEWSCGKNIGLCELPTSVNYHLLGSNLIEVVYKLKFGFKIKTRNAEAWTSGRVVKAYCWELPIGVN